MTYLLYSYANLPAINLYYYGCGCPYYDTFLKSKPGDIILVMHKSLAGYVCIAHIAIANGK